MLLYKYSFFLLIFLLRAKEFRVVFSKFSQKPSFTFLRIQDIISHYVYPSDSDNTTSKYKGAFRKMRMNTKHMVCDFYDCTFDLLNDPDFLRRSLQAALREGDLNQLDNLEHRMNPSGLIFVVIAEGTHLTLHTYPELGYAAADIFTTDSHCAPDKIMNALKKSLRSDKMKATNIKRGDFGSIADMKPKTKTSMTPLGRVKTLSAKVTKMIKKKKKKRK